MLTAASSPYADMEPCTCPNLEISSVFVQAWSPSGKREEKEPLRKQNANPLAKTGNSRDFE
ncbi:hypothetical protein COLO4_35887 [Corchorus olitorius]|uniref:Uncharacterized protein n=1 Tax=Corchorus olitorius TaxID=93759 RepID=A0A1R3GC98_9ROSI|nr:hypothetical protein COLO4_35887 [Corchorus olitorius]